MAISLRILGLSMVVLLGALVLGLASPGQALAMPDHSVHGSMKHATPDGVPADGASFDIAADSGADQGGGCPDGLMADCCVMTCCSATTPDAGGEAAHYVVIAARSSRPTVAGGRVIVPPLQPPKPLS